MSLTVETQVYYHRKLGRCHFSVFQTLFVLRLFRLFFFLECQNYKNLTSADRNVNYGKRGVECDADIVPGWFRFQGEAGTQMATTCPPHWSCNSGANGWMKGELPSVADGRVTRMACFHVSNRCCFSFKYIQVRNCGEYYVYYLNGTPDNSCTRYCGSD